MKKKFIIKGYFSLMKYKQDALTQIGTVACHLHICSNTNSLTLFEPNFSLKHIIYAHSVCISRSFCGKRLKSVDLCQFEFYKRIRD